MNASIHTWMGGYTDTYLFSFHRTHEDGNYYYVYLGVPIVEMREVDGTGFVITFADDITNSGAFHVYTTGTSDGIKYDCIGLYPTSTYLVATAETYEVTLRQFIAAVYDKVTDCPVLTNICKSYSPELYI